LGLAFGGAPLLPCRLPPVRHFSNRPLLRPLKHTRYTRHHMTICVGALAAGGKSIVCVADKSVSYGDHVWGETDSTKIVELTSGSVAMVSGDEFVFDRFLRALNRNPKLGCSIPDTVRYCEDSYRSTRKELVSINYLDTNLLTEQHFTQATTGTKVNRHIERLAMEISKFKVDCSILLCGFDEHNQAYLIYVDEPGNAVDLARLGYHAIGSGYEYSIGRLVWSERTRNKGIEESLYHILDAKISAEINPYVGGDWDAVILVPGKVHRVPDKIVALLDEVWSYYDRSPYYVREPDDQDPPRNWKASVSKYVKGLSGPSPSPQQGDKVFN